MRRFLKWLLDQVWVLDPLEDAFEEEWGWDWDLQFVEDDE